MADLKPLFEAYGADYETTMRRFMGNEAVYRRILNLLFQDANLRKLGDALGRGDLDEAFEAAHTLKGVAGNLGLAPLHEAVCAIVEPLRAGENRDYSAMYQAIRAEYGRVETLWEDLERGD